MFNILISMVLGFVDGAAGLTTQFGSGILSGLYSLAVLIPGLAVAIRRLHDTGKSGWWLLLSFIPLVGAIVLIVFLVQDSQHGTNQYGPNPKEAAPLMAKPSAPIG